MQQNSAQEFYRKITQGKDYHKKIELEADGLTLPNVEMHVVSKQTLGDVIERLPEAVIDAGDDIEAEDIEDIDEDELDSDINMADAMTSEMIAGLEEAVASSLQHGDLTDRQMRELVGELSLELLIDLGMEVIEISIENSGDIEDFHELN